MPAKTTKKPLLGRERTTVKSINNYTKQNSPKPGLHLSGNYCARDRCKATPSEYLAGVLQRPSEWKEAPLLLLSWQIGTQMNKENNKQKFL